MYRRFLLVFLPLLTASTGLANQDTWACQQAKNSNQWVCLSDQKTRPTAAEPARIPALQTPPTAPALRVKPTAPPVEPLAPRPSPIDRQVPAPAVTKRQPAPEISQPSTKAPRPAPAAAPEKPQTTEPETLEASYHLGLLNPVFTRQQEQIFADLTARLPADPWANCTLEPADRVEPGDAQAARSQVPIDVKSNYSEIFDHKTGTYAGKVELRHADRHAHADHAIFDNVSETLDLHGNVYYHDDEFALHSDSATLKLATDQAKLRDTLFIAARIPLRGYAKGIYRDSEWLSHYQDVSYTSCRPGNQDWAIHAAEMKINRQSGQGSAKHAWMEFKGVPVFYSPYLAFPVDNRRVSGFLAPSFGNTRTSGFNITTPYYWNIAPNYDATLSPTYFSDRGALLGTQFRYLTSTSSGQASANYMPNDSQLDNDRYFLSLKHHTQFTEHLNTHLDLNTVSDRNYFAELGNMLIFPTFSFVKSEADINYLTEGIAFTTRAESYQTIDSSLSTEQIPYRRLPQVKLELNHAFDFMPLGTTFETETVNFQHNDLVDGQRIHFKPSASFPLRSDLGFITPKVSVQYTEYFLQNQPGGLPENISRVLPITSLDTGTYLERDLTLWDNPLLHTLEPRLFYLYIPKTQQSDIPLFDTTLYDFWYQSLFRENRFSGSDRIQDANQISAALTSRLLDPVNGRERLTLNLGQIFYFRNRDVTLEYTGYDYLLDHPPVTQRPETSPYSPFVVELSSELNRHVSVDTGIQWDYDTNTVMRGKAMVHFMNEPDEIINLGFLYRQDPLVPDQSNDITQSDMSFRWPLLETWHLVGRWQYSWLYNRTMDGFFGVERENCCWRFRVISRTYLNSINRLVGAANQAVEGSTQTGIFFQVELKGLTGLGTQLEDFFEQSIFGYRKPAK